MSDRARRLTWNRLYAIATWALIGYFAVMAVIHLVITILFWLGIWDTGVGYLFDFDVPAWSITVLDASAAGMLWFGSRRTPGRELVGLALTVVASFIMLARALWFVIVPIFVAIAVVGSAMRYAAARRSIDR